MYHFFLAVVCQSIPVIVNGISCLFCWHLQIAPSAKKLWGVEEQKEDTKSLFNISDQAWRDSTWSTSTIGSYSNLFLLIFQPTANGFVCVADHAVSQPITMGPRRSGSFPGSEVANVLSPRSSETGGLGVKMVEYVLGTSPTNKDLESRMRALVLVSCSICVSCFLFLVNLIARESQFQLELFILLFSFRIRPTTRIRRKRLRRLPLHSKI